MANQGATRSTSGGGSKSSPSFRIDFGNPQKSVDTSSIDQRDDSGADDFDYESAIRRADESDNPDGYKYQVAVELAQDRAGDDVSDSEMRDLIDAEYAKLNPTSTGEQIRGEDNAGAAFVGGVNDAIDYVTNAAGDLTAGAWDNLIGGGAQLLGDLVGNFTGDSSTGENWGNAVRGLVGNGDGSLVDTGMLADMALGLGVSAIPGIGVPLSVGLAGIQNADNIREAIEGRDSVTRRELDGDARGSKLAASALNIGLAALPGLGRLRNTGVADDMANAAIDAASGSTDDVMRAMAEVPVDQPISQSVRSGLSSAADEAGSRIGNAVTAARESSGAREAVGNVVNALRTPTTRGTIRQFNQAVVPAMRGGSKLSGAVDDAVASFAGVVPEAAEEAGSHGIRAALRNLANGGVGRAAKSGVGNAVASGAMVPLGVGAAGVNYAADTNQGILPGMADYMDAMMNTDGGFSTVVTNAVPLGIGALSRGLFGGVGPSGRVTNINTPLRYQQLASIGRSGSDLGERANGDVDYDYLDYFLTGGDEDGSEE